MCSRQRRACVPSRRSRNPPLLFRYLDIQKAKDRKYSQSWQQQHTADELKVISKAVNLLSEKGIYTLEELDAALSAVHDKAIYIEAPDKSSGKRHQGIRISYDLVVFIPVEELLKQETA